jgi:hypothetical protein
MLHPNHPMSRINAIDSARIAPFADSDNNEKEPEPIIAHGKLAVTKVEFFAPWYVWAVATFILPTT